jgi:hypothetical protein
MLMSICENVINSEYTTCVILIALAVLFARCTFASKP